MSSTEGGVYAVRFRAPPRSAYRNRRRGFNLIESAIVLGVVGFVLGGIWIVSAKFYEDYRVNKTASDLQLIVKNIQGLISMRDAETIGGGGIELTPTILVSGVLPTNWTDGNIIRSPFGYRVRVFNYAPPINPDQRFLISLYGVPTSFCVNLVVKISSAAAMAGSRGSGAYGHTSLGIITIFNGVTYE